MNEQDQRVRDYYDSMSMPKDRLEMLLKVSAESSAKLEAEKQSVSAVVSAWSSRLTLLPKFRWNSWLQTGIACGVILMMSLWMHNTGTETERAERTLREVAMNHTTRLEPEFRGTSLANLDNSMHQLPFNLKLPKSIDSAYELIGSRYCSLGGVLAAHVKLHDKQSGKPMSLFVTSNSSELEQINPQQHELEGVEVEIWREGGLFFASAQRS